MDHTFQGIVLAGGKSRRMGRNKAFITFRGKRLIDWSFDLLSEFTNHITVSANSKEWDSSMFTVVRDEIKDVGPMGGIHAVLQNSKHLSNILLPCDTPMIDKAIIDRLIAEMEVDKIIYAKTSDGIHPLIGIYPKAAQNWIKECIESDNYRMTDLLDNYPSKSIDFKDLDSEKFVNFNKIEDIPDD